MRDRLTDVFVAFALAAGCAGCAVLLAVIVVHLVR